MNLLFYLIALCSSKDPISAPGDVLIENSITAKEISLPDSSKLSCTSGDLNLVIADSTFSSYITSSTVSVTTIIAEDSDILISGKVKITGSISYTSELQIGMDQHTTFLGSSFLEIIKPG